MRQPDFGWSYPPGCSGPPDDIEPDADEEPDDDVPVEVGDDMPDENDLSDAALNAAYWEAVDKD